MPLNLTAVQSLRRVFQQGFSVYDIAEPLVSFDEGFDPAKLAQLMQAQGLEVVGIRQAGRVAGYLRCDQIGTGEEPESQVQTFAEDLVVSDSTSFAELIPRLVDHRRLFVSMLGAVGGIVSRTDLQKPPVRMWLFGMVTLIEMRFTRMIEQHCEGDTWHAYISAGRLQKATELRDERTRRNQHVGLLDCLQLADKAQIVARHPDLRQRTRFESRRQLEEAAKRLEKLRNNLAHSQDILAEDWETIVLLAQRLDDILEGPPGLQSETSA